MKKTPLQIKNKKGKISMLTCYDYSFASVLDKAGLDMVLVGDSLANVVLGMKETRRVTIAEMLNHTRAVASACRNTLVVADMPYSACQKDHKRSLYYAEKFMAAGAGAVKIEWFKRCPDVVRRLIKNKIPVMGHIGLTPQTAHLLGGFKVQGKTIESARDLLEQAQRLDELGVFSLILECVPAQLAAFITKKINPPTIGIGAGRYCRGQVLVLYDILGLYPGFRPKFVRVYSDLSQPILRAVSKFKADISSSSFPAGHESFAISASEWRKIRKILK